MTPLEIVLLALALSIDAFAVSLVAAATGRVNGPRATFRLSFHFGLFQCIMPVLGWSAGQTLEGVLGSVDHWVAFGLLCLIGVRMIHAGIRGTPGQEVEDPSRGMLLMALSIATSIDALAVGFSMSLLNITIWWPSVLIGLITGILCVVAIQLGSRVESRVGRWAEAGGGVLLIAIAVNILISHLTPP